MSSSEGIFSLRLVIADFYMEKPVPGLDPVYSEFRGKEIKKVPIIRVFGSNAQGQKTCMHIHGVFPYLYVPYDQKDFESANKALHQMALNLDKAINISLSQGSSEMQHVYKVQLVKGIPFYGYHRSEHHYLKIYMFNPRFVRRAANLLQNGAIMNKNFHPHESHVPYILQFMIDYNLYGMSFIHIPLEIVKFRRSDDLEQIPFRNVKESQILDNNVVKKLSCSTLEVDIGSNFILNRFQLIAKTNSTHTNPGIESIWNDEKMRRQNMAQQLEDDEEKLKAIPPLEVPTTQERPNIQPAESEVFYRTALVSKLIALEMESTQGSDQTINNTLHGNLTNTTTSTNSSNSFDRRHKKTFNLSKILQNSVYPEECTEKQNVVSASFVTNHLSSNNAFEQSLQIETLPLSNGSSDKVTEDESIFLDNTVVDEELVLSLTQAQEKAHVPLDATLRDEDLQLLDLLQQLEEDNNENKIDLDSTLAPMSQHKDYALSPETLEKNGVLSGNPANSSDVENDEDNGDDDNIHDFSIALENLDDLILKFTQSQTNMDDSNSKDDPSNALNQVDGTDDLLGTPTKSKRRTTIIATSPPRTPTHKPRCLSQATSPRRSPKTPKSMHKHRPLPLIITNRSAGKTLLNGDCGDSTPEKSSENDNNISSNILRKKLAINNIWRKSLCLETNELKETNKSNTKPRRSKTPRDLDKTHVTCNLTPRKTNEKLLKVYNLEQQTKPDLTASTSRKNNDLQTISKLPRTPLNTAHTEENKKLQEKNDSTSHVPQNEEDDEVVIESDEESIIQLRKTPNLKRLRRSFLSSSTKKRKIEKNSDNNVNSSKFKNTTTTEESMEEKRNALAANTPKESNTTEYSKKSENSEKLSDSLDIPGTEELKSIELVMIKDCSRTVSGKDQIIKGTSLECNLKQDNKINNETLEKETEIHKGNQSIENILTNGKNLATNESKKLRKHINVATKNLQSRLETNLDINGEENIKNKIEICEGESKKIKSHQENKEVTETRSLRSMKNLSKLPVAKKTNESERNKNSETTKITTRSSNSSSEIIQPLSKHTDALNEKILQPAVSNLSNRNLKKDQAKETVALEFRNKKLSEPKPSSVPKKDLNKYFPLDKNAQDCKLNFKLTKNVRVKLRRIKIANDGNINAISARDHTTPKKSAISQSVLKAKNTEIQNETTPTLQENEATINESLHLAGNDNYSENLLKSLLLLNGSIRSDLSSRSISSSEIVSKIPTVESSSLTPLKGQLQESLLIDNSSEDEIDGTPTSCDNNKNSHVYKKFPSLCSPVLFTQNSSPNIMSRNIFKAPSSKSNSISNSHEIDIVSVSSSNETNENVKEFSTTPANSCIILTPLDIPPTREEILQGCAKLNLPEYEFQQPYYSNPEDVTKSKEIGFTVLQIKSNKINDLEEFESLLGADLQGINRWRRKQLLQLGGPEMLNKYRNTQRIREYFAGPKQVAITPFTNAPTRHEVKLWLKARELLKSKGEKLEKNEDIAHRLTEEDSPIKIRRQKVTMMLNNENGESEEGADLDCSMRSLTLTPMTPGTPLAEDRLQQRDSKNTTTTPLTTKIEKIPLERVRFLGRRNNRRVLKRVSLNQKMKEALKIQDIECPKDLKNSEECSKLPQLEESIVQNSQASESSSVSSQTALNEMERPSFMNQVQHDVSIAFGSNNSTLNNSFGFKVALENLQQAKADIEFNYLTIITLEVFVPTRDDLYPNPQIDEIRCIFYAIENSIPNDHCDENKKLPRNSCGYIMVHDSRDIVAKEGKIHGIDQDIIVTIVNTEVEALEALLGLCTRWDADIYAGYEIEMSSWGFIIERAKYLCLNIAPLLSRVPSQKTRDYVDEDREQFTDLDVEMKLCGRILLDVWRLMRSEIALTSYTFENVMYHIMHKRCPWHSYRTLTEWYGSPCSRWIVIEYYLERVRGTLSLLDQLDLLGRTSEMAKLIGIQFYEVLSRGSQFRVESMMLRIAKPKNLVPLSPSVQQRAHMRAPEYLPLILEPLSRFYADPLIVLDFQSLYPSMIIGYNYCFSTCLGRVEHLGQPTPFEFGASQLRVSPSMLRKLLDRDLVTISPCGVVFVKSSVREGILPRMLTEILDTRQMVKQSMKLHKTNSALQRILHSRQLGLKLMANTTYGYTAANFSGRMPAVEVGDTVVAKGRETLEKAIKMVEANEKWNVKVVYGDTDSLFVLVPGRNREEAFRIGEEIAEAVTKQNPQPVKLKLEKVYQPCILQTKKRYVGYMYETADQKEPVYEAKGIETVRRDGCPMVAKMLEKVLRILFESADVSQVKQYVCRQFTKLLSGRANIQDLIFAKEFRGLNGYKPTACVPALEMTRKWLQTDPRRIPRRGERVPFIITNGPPGVPLIRLIRHPHEVLSDEGLKINAIYYITKAIIPPLNRCLLLLGADVHEWFANLPRKVLMTPALSMANEIIPINPFNSKSKKSTISQFFSTTNCITDCGRHTKQGICSQCSDNPLRTMAVLQMKISKIERAYHGTQQICQACCGRLGDLKCGSLDCPVLYVLEVKCRDLQQIGHFRNLFEDKF